MNSNPVLFDAALPLLLQVVSKNFERIDLETSVVLRDATGRLSLLISRAAASQSERERFESIISEALGAYASTTSAIGFKGDAGVDKLLNDPAQVPVRVDGLRCNLLDRRIVGEGWLQSPKAAPRGPIRVVFASLKGGVGRSTALAVTAMDLARRNKNVLVVDLDIEAPGVGRLLLTEDRLPKFGVLDFLVENGIGGVSDRDLTEFVGVSNLTTAEGGKVDVLPAVGSQADIAPYNVLPKLARAMVEDITADGESISLSSQISSMIERFTVRENYDVILIDSRAGLAELAAPSVVGLGAIVLLFAGAQLQTFDGYKALFAGLGLLASRDRQQGRSADWRLNLKFVYAKASMDEALLSWHRDTLYDLFSAQLYDEEIAADDDLDRINFSIDDESAPHWPLIIPFNQGFVDFEPTRNLSQLTRPFYEQTFRPFLDGLDLLLEDVETSTQESSQ